MTEVSKERQICWASVNRITQSQLMPPAVRMVVVSAWWENNEGGFIIDPVVSLWGRVVHAYSKQACSQKEAYRERLKAPGTHRELVEQGWRYTGYSFQVSPLICSPDEGIDDPIDWAAGACNAAAAAFACPWLPEEDEKRLSLAIANLIQEAKIKATRQT